MYVFCLPCYRRVWYEAVTSVYMCAILHVVKGIVVNILGYFTPTITVIMIIRWPLTTMRICDIHHFDSDISAVWHIVGCAVASSLQVVQSTGRNPLASSHVWLNAGSCDGSVCNSTWRAAGSGPLFRWLGSNATDCGPRRAVTGSILSYHWCEYCLCKVRWTVIVTGTDHIDVSTACARLDGVWWQAQTTSILMEI
jgi:hypothetical protein